VSEITTEAVAPPVVIVNVSELSVVWSAAMGIEIVALPAESTTAEPVSDPPTISLDVIPTPESV